MYVEDILRLSTTGNWASRAILGDGYLQDTSLADRPVKNEITGLSLCLTPTFGPSDRIPRPPHGVLALDLGFWGAPYRITKWRQSVDLLCLQVVWLST